jgi:hypothetical protein
MSPARHETVLGRNARVDQAAWISLRIVGISGVTLWPTDSLDEYSKIALART